MTHNQKMSPIEMELIKWLSLQIQFFGSAWIFILFFKNLLPNQPTHFSKGKVHIKASIHGLFTNIKIYLPHMHYSLALSQSSHFAFLPKMVSTQSLIPTI